MPIAVLGTATVLGTAVVTLIAWSANTCPIGAAAMARAVMEALGASTVRTNICRIAHARALARFGALLALAVAGAGVRASLGTVGAAKVGVAQACAIIALAVRVAIVQALLRVTAVTSPAVGALAQVLSALAMARTPLRATGDRAVCTLVAFGAQARSLLASAMAAAVCRASRGTAVRTRPTLLEGAVVSRVCWGAYTLVVDAMAVRCVAIGRAVG